MTDASMFEITQRASDANLEPQVYIRIPVSRFESDNDFADLLGTAGAPLVQAVCDERGLGFDLSDITIEQARELAASVAAEPIAVDVKGQELSIALNVQ